MQLIHTLFAPPGDGPHPTILALHGWGANALDLLGLAPHICDGRYLVLCPQGPTLTPIGPGAVGYGWFPATRGGPPDIPAIMAARDQLWAFVEAASVRYAIDRARLLVLGFSQGGVMAYSMALAEPQRFAALVAMSTWLPPVWGEEQPVDGALQRLPILVQHGSRDELVQVERARQAVESLRQWRMPLTYREYDMGHEINARSLADLSAWLQEKVR
jgi:phospholipase/carboxylesterase